jgi:hypothetical protein
MSTTTPTRSSIFKKWRTWRDRLRHEFLSLLVAQRHFHELQFVIKSFIGTNTGAELARSMAHGYSAVAFTALRRIGEPVPKRPAPKWREIISLPTLITEVQANADLVTRWHQRRRYKTAMQHLPARIYTEAADRAHDSVANGDEILRPASVQKDLSTIERTVRRLSKLTDKVYAHIERDRRRIPRHFPFAEVDTSIRILFQILRKYSLLLFGEEVVLPDIEEFSIIEDLRKVWPGDDPLPDFPFVVERLEEL